MGNWLPDGSWNKESAFRRARRRRQGLGLHRVPDRDCKLNDVEPLGYLTSTLEAIVKGHPMKCLNELLPGPFAKKSIH